MEYSPELFKEDKALSYDTKYRYELSGAFYDVYTNGNGDYHMAIENKASLLERIRFFDLYISKTKYPVFSSPLGMTLESSSSSEVLFQVLGLPLEVMVKKDKTSKSLPLTPDEIISRISFEDGLFKGYGEIKDLNSDVLTSNHFAIIGVINYLIENGFFFQNPERMVMGGDIDEGSLFPIYVDEEKIPERYKKENETGDKLLIDFGEKLLNIDKDGYLKFYRPINDMTLTQKADFAFKNDTANENNPAYQSAKNALVSYFYAIIKGLINDFFVKHYNSKNLLPNTVLTHDLQSININPRFIYYGVNFDMVSSDFRHFSKQGEEVTETLDPQSYTCCLLDKERIKNSYIATKNYFLKHPDLAFVPPIFIKLMGMPYPAYLATKFYDFENGDAEHFVNLLTFNENLTFRENGIVLSFAQSNGTIYSPSNDTKQIFNYILGLGDRGLFINAFNDFFDLPDDCPYFLYFNGNDEKINLFTSGDTETFKECLDDLEKTTYNIAISLNSLSVLRAFVNYDDHEGKLLTVKKYFSLLNEGYNSTEATSLVIGADSRIDSLTFQLLISSSFNYLFSSEASKYFDSLVKRQEKGVFSLVSQGENFTDPYLPITNVYKGRLFIAYLDKDNQFYFDSDDEEALNNLHKIFRRFFLSSQSFLYLVSLYGNEYLYRFEFPTCKDYSVEAVFLGIPQEVILGLDLNKDIISQLNFKPKISIANQKDHVSVIRNDPSLAMPMVFRQSLRKGVYILGKENTNRPFYSLREKADEDLRLYFSPDFIKINFEKSLDNPNNSVSAKSISRILDMDDDAFRSTFLDYVYGYKDVFSKKKTVFDNDVSELASSYAGHLNRSFFQMTYHSFFNDEDKSRHYLVSYPHLINDARMNVSPGPNFFAFSDTKKLISFYLLKEDQEAFLFALSAVSNKYSKISNKKERARKESAALGLPVCYQERFYRTLVAKKHPSMKEIKKIFGFSVSQNFSLKDLPSYFDTLRTIKPDFSHYFHSTQLNNEALREGFFIATGTNLMDERMFDHVALSKEIEYAANFAEKRTAAISDDPSGVIKEVFLPNPITYSSYVNHFISLYTNSYLRADFLFYAKEALEYAFSLDNRFIVKAINNLQDGSKLKYETYLLKTFKNFKLKEMKKNMPESFLFGFIVLFLLNLEQIAIFKISKKTN